MSGTAGRTALHVATAGAAAMILFAAGSAIMGHDRPVPLGNSTVEPADAYKDRFVTGLDETFVTTGTARLRDFPTLDGSRILATLDPGTRLSGRRVYAAGGSGEWLRTEHAGLVGYLWTGNLTVEAALEADAPAAPTGDAGVAQDAVNGTAPAEPADAAPRQDEASREPDRPTRQRGKAAPRPKADTGIRCMLPDGEEARMSYDECTRNAGVELGS
jgi:hypothetical protein